MVLRGSISLLVAANIKKALQTTSTTNDITGMSSKEGRRTSRVTKKDASAPCKHLYGREVSRVLSGDHFGEEALLQREEQALHTARTNEMVELLLVDAETFDQCLQPYFQEILLKRAGFLAELEWFKNWNPHLLRQLSFMLREHHYKFEECLYRQGMSVAGIWFIQSGSVRISTQRDAQPPEELLDKIEPPKDFLPEILAEDLPEQTQSKVSVLSNMSRGSSVIDTHCLGQITNASTVSLSKSPSQTLLQKRQTSACTKKPKTKEKGRAVIGYVIHRPNPKTNVDLCILGPGDILCDNEAICRLRRNLFNAVCESDVTIYELNKFYFELMFESRMPRVVHQMACRAQQRAACWKGKYKDVRFFEPLMFVLEQTVEKLEIEGSHKVGRKKPLYTPSMLAWTAIKGLGKAPQETAEGRRRRSSVHPVVQIQISSDSYSSQAQCPVTPIPLSPFEPSIPDFERMAGMMSFTHPRFKNNPNARRLKSGKSIFDSPFPVRESSDCDVSSSDTKCIQDSIPVPKPYPNAAPTVPATPHNTAPVVDNKPKPEKDKLCDCFPTANDPDTLAKIRLGILFGTKSSTISCGCSDMADAKNRLYQTKSQSKPSSRSKLTAKDLIVPILSTPALRSISLDRHMQTAKQSSSAEEKDETNTVKTETRISFSMDNELTDIPNEYSRLCGTGKWPSWRGAGGCAVCHQQYRHNMCGCSAYYSLPFMKTMMRVIENRTSSLLTKYVKELVQRGGAVLMKLRYLEGRKGKETGSVAFRGGCRGRGLLCGDEIYIEGKLRHINRREMPGTGEIGD